MTLQTFPVAGGLHRVHLVDGQLGHLLRLLLPRCGQEVREGWKERGELGKNPGWLFTRKRHFTVDLTYLWPPRAMDYWARMLPTLQTSYFFQEKLENSTVELFLSLTVKETLNSSKKKWKQFLTRN